MVTAKPNENMKTSLTLNVFLGKNNRTINIPINAGKNSSAINIAEKENTAKYCYFFLKV